MHISNAEFGINNAKIRNPLSRIAKKSYNDSFDVKAIPIIFYYLVYNY